jgi:hypothetical protein
MVAWTAFSDASRCAKRQPFRPMISMSPMPMEATTARRYFSWKSFASNGIAGA